MPSAPRHVLTILVVALLAGAGCKKDDGAAEHDPPNRPGEPAAPTTGGDTDGRLDLMGVTLRPPAGADQIDSGLDHARYFHQGAQVLIDLAVNPSGCARALEPEWQSWQKLRADPAQAELNRIVKAERLEGDRGPGFHIESFTRTPDEAKANRPEHPVALTFLCGDHASLLITVSQRDGELTPAARNIERALIESVRIP